MTATGGPWESVGDSRPAAVPGTSAAENVALLLLTGLLAVTVLVWATGEVAGRVFHGSWPRVSVGEMPSVLARLVHHVGDPRRAWPAAVADTLPAPVGFCAVFALISSVAMGTSACVVAAARRGRRRGAGINAAWARPADVARLVVKGPVAGRLILGTAGGRLLATEERHSVCVIGPTQTGKTSGFAVPALLEWNGPVVAASVKDDLLAATVAHRRDMGRVWLFDPTGSTGLPAAGWSPLAAIRDWGDALRVSAWLVAAAEARENLEAADYWHGSAEKYLAPYLWAAAQGRATMRDVVRWVNRREVAEVDAILEECGPPEARDEAWANWETDERAKSAIVATTRLILKAFSVPSIAAMSDHSAIKPDALLDGGRHTLYLCAPPDDQDWLRPLFATLVQQVVKAVYRRVTEGNRLRAPLLVVLDEAANIAPLPDLDTIASTAAGMGIQLVTVWQDMAQIKTRYGERGYSVVNNHRAKVVLSCISDPGTLDYVSRLVGQHEVSHDSVTRDSHGVRSTSESTAYRPLAPADALRRIVPGHGVLLYGHLLPARLRLRPYYERPEFASPALGSEPLRITEEMDAKRRRARCAASLDVDLDVAGMEW